MVLGSQVKQKREARGEKCGRRRRTQVKGQKPKADSQKYQGPEGINHR